MYELSRPRSNLDTIWPLNSLFLKSENSAFPGNFCYCFCNGKKSEGSYLLMAKKWGQLIIFLCNKQWTVLYDWPSLATILQPFNSVIGLFLTDSNHSMRCVHFSCRQLILLTNFLRFLEFRRHSSKRKTATSEQYATLFNFEA